MTKDVYLSVAGFRIKVAFCTSRNNTVQKKLIREFYSLFDTYIIEKNHFKCEFLIVIKDSKINTLNFIPDGQSRLVRIFSNFFERTGKYKIISYYHISINQLKYLIFYSIEKLLSRNGGFFLRSSSFIYSNKVLLIISKENINSLYSVFLHFNCVLLSKNSLIIRKINGSYCAFQNLFIPDKTQSENYPIDKIIVYDKSETEFSLDRVVHKNRYMNKIIQYSNLHDFSLGGYENSELPSKYIQNTLAFIDKMELWQLKLGKVKKERLKIITKLFYC